MKVDTIPDITMRGQDDPHDGAGTLLTPAPTVGRMAARIHTLAARPTDWWDLVSFDPERPVRVPLDGGDGDGDGVQLWLTTWPPGSRSEADHHRGTEVVMLTAGVLTEVTVGPNGGTERTLGPSRLRVHGSGNAHELRNQGPTYAITIHAHLP
jgi:hypothetical protein